MSNQVRDIQEDRFDQQVLQQSTPVIIDFWAPWCGPCKTMTSAFESLAKVYGNRMLFFKCNVDENLSVAKRFGIKAIPKLMLFNNGELVHSATGMMPQDAIEEVIENVLAGEKIPAPFLINEPYPISGMKRRAIHEIAGRLLQSNRHHPKTGRNHL